MSKEKMELSPEVAAAIGEAVAHALGDVLPKIIEAVKAPNPIEQRQIEELQKEIAEKQKERLHMSKQVLEEAASREAFKKLCSHEHRNGDGHCVHVQDKLPHGYVMCMVCNVRVRPELPEETRKLDSRAVYDTQLFNRLFQKVPSMAVFGIAVKNTQRLPRRETWQLKRFEGNGSVR